MSGARQRTDVERFALAAALKYPDLVEESGLKPEHFAAEALGEAFAALPRVTMRTPEGQIAAMHLAEASGVSIATLREALACQAYDPEQARHWWSKLRDLANADALVAELRVALAEDRPGEDVTPTLLAKVEAVVRSFSASEVDRELVTLDELAERYIDERLAEIHQGRRRGVATGLELVDRWMGGLNPGEVTTIVAAGGVGKTTVAVDIARRVAADGGVVLYVSGEMTSRQLGQREAHAAIGRAISDHGVGGRELAEARDEVAASRHRERVFVDERSRPTQAQVLAAARRLQHRHGLALVIFDHLGCFNVERPKASEQEQVAQAIQALKDVAKILDVPLIVVTHWNRQEQIRGSERVRDISDNVLELRRNADDPQAYTEARLLKARQTGEIYRKMLLHYSLKWQTYREAGDEPIGGGASRPAPAGRAPGADDGIPF